MTKMAIAGQFAIEERKRSIPATMLAAVYRGVNDIRLETVTVPKLGAGELLLRVHTCGIWHRFKEDRHRFTFGASNFRS